MERFRPSKHGFHFSNSTWPNVPDFKIDIPFISSIPVGNAANGMCGGMAFAALDYYLAERPIPAQKTNPGFDDPLFKYIYSRLLASFDIPFGMLKVYAWMAHDGDLVARTRDEEIPAITAELQERPVPIVIIWVQSRNPMDGGKNHQVLVYDITQDGLKTVLHVYDNNYPDDDNLTITCDGSKLIHSVEGQMRGLFRSKYQRRIP